MLKNRKKLFYLSHIILKKYYTEGKKPNNKYCKHVKSYFCEGINAIL